MINTSRPTSPHGAPPQNEMAPKGFPSSLYLIFLYFCCFLVTITYVNLYSIFRFFKDLFGSGFITWSPVILALTLPISIFLLAAKMKRKGPPLQWSWIITGGALCCLALFIPDPEFGAKRIHVAEYILLSLICRYALSHRHSGNYLLLMSCLFTVVCGIHEEFLQGLHPQRTYGLKDILVNSVATLGGSFIWQGLYLFSPHNTYQKIRRQDWQIPTLYLCWLCLSIVMVIVPSASYKNDILPFWIFLPLAASAVFLTCFLNRIHPALRHGIIVISSSALALILYPVITNALSFTFY